jgi:L-Lysine epsilon oxidase N-terminal/L-lysine epsilon oxidase C-terminal domain/Iron-containing redox enzyme
MNEEAAGDSLHEAVRESADQQSENPVGEIPKIAYCKIFPAIGIARLGNSPDEYFVGPEVPGLAPPNGGSYKDAQGRVKRQAARFRVYGFNERDEVVAELHADHSDVAEITWSVTLANAKAEWWQFAGTEHVAQILNGRTETARRRNEDVQGNNRKGLVIGPATGNIGGRGQRSGPLDGRFLTWPEKVYLGELRTDDAGRLLILGGHGRSASTLPDNPLAHYANNDRWYDDTADGPVTVTVTLQSGESLPVRGHAWVVVTPPHFSPHTQNVVTAYDVMTEAAVEHNLLWPEAELGPRPAETDPVLFTRDVYPILRRLSMYQWVSDRARRGHSTEKPGNFLDPAMLRVLADPAQAKEAQSPQRRIFARLRTPLLHYPGLDARQPTADELHPFSQEAINQANLSFMPPLAGDEGDVTHPIYDAETNRLAPRTWFSLTATQYRKLARWKEGDFVNDWDGTIPLPLPPPASFDAVPVAQQPAALTRAALEACQGGAFFPGIEFTSIIRFAQTYREAFRLSDDLAAGDITRWMALPWQADFYECRDHWWPSIRPDDVVPDEEYERILEEFQGEASQQNISSLLVVRRPWARGIGLNLPPRPGLPVWPPPSPGLPEWASITTAADYQRLWQRQLANFARAYRAAVPAPAEGEIEGVYLRRLQEFLDRSGLTRERFSLPPKDPTWSLDQYWNNPPPEITDPEERERRSVVGSIRIFFREQTQIPDPEPGELLDAYAARLAGEAAQRPVWQGLLDMEWRRRVRHRGKNDLLTENNKGVPNWSHLGFVVPRSAFGEIVYVEGDRGRYELLPFRDYFHYLLNLEQYADFLPKARELADEYLRLAWELEPQLRTSPAFEQYGFFAYDSVTFQARLEKIYERLRRTAEAYNPATGDGEPLFRTATQIVERIRQLAPFNQLDGSWLEKIAQAGPSDEVQGYLFEIWSDEIGNGNPAQNHANVYTDLLHSAGIYLPPIASRAYADTPTIWDSSYISPAYQSAIAQFPETYAPELLGMTLYLEWEAIFLPAMVKLYEYHGYNPLFYKLHVAIDNPVNGHGAKARDAVARYLDHVREESGEREMQEHWRRVWNGYLAFAFIGGGDWQYFFTNPRSPEERVLDMFTQKRHYAQLNHGLRRLGPNFINNWFDEPDAFLQQLVQSDLITPGDAKNSRIFATMEFGGPMLKVFSAEDKELLAQYINSLPPAPLGTGLDPASAMRVLLRELSARGMAVPDHAGFVLTGTYVDPAQGDELEVRKPVSWWFQINQPERLMAALANPNNGWIIPGNVAESRFVRVLLSEPRRMSRFLIQTVPELGDRSAREVIIDWIAAGCPIPELDARMLLKKAIPVPRTNVRLAAPVSVPEPIDPHVGVIQARTLNSVPLTPEQHEGLKHRYYGPGGGACH